MTRKDYVAVAEILSSYKDLIGDEFLFEDLVEDFSSFFAEDNPNSKHILTNVNNNYEWSDIINHVDHANKNTISRNTFGIN